MVPAPKYNLPPIKEGGGGGGGEGGAGPNKKLTPSNPGGGGEGKGGEKCWHGGPIFLYEKSQLFKGRKRKREVEEGEGQGALQDLSR